MKRTIPFTYLALFAIAQLNAQGRESGKQLHRLLVNSAFNVNY